MPESIDTDFREWIWRLQRTEPPDRDIKAFNFGIFESPDGYNIYLSGAKEYTADNEDWACANDYYPTGRFFQTPLPTKTWEDAQKTAAELVKEFLTSPNSSGTFLSDRIVTVGFDDGNLEWIQ